MEQREFVVEQETAGQRIDRFLSGEDTGLSRSALQGTAEIHTAFLAIFHPGLRY